MRLVILIATVLVLGLCQLAPARAQTAEDRAAGQVLFDEGNKLFKAGDYHEAARKLEASLERMPQAVGTRGKLAECYEKLGRTASAWAMWREVASMSRKANQVERAEVADARVAALEPKLPRLSIEVPLDAPELAVRIDGRKLSEGELETPLPLDPGDHVVTATAAGKGRFEETVTLVNGKTERVRVTLVGGPKATPEPASEPKNIPYRASDADRAAFAAAAEEPTPASSGGNGRRTWGWVLTSVGVASLATAGVLSYLAVKNDDDGKVDKAIDQANLATGFVIAGGVLTAGGVILWLTAPSANPESRAVGLTPRFGQGSASLVVVGSF
jgi:tetratricopeptide (TPR) repeat protein